MLIVCPALVELQKRMSSAAGGGASGNVSLSQYRTLPKQSVIDLPQIQQGVSQAIVHID